MTIATIVRAEPRWAFMWLLAFAIFAVCKALTWWTTPTHGISLALQLGYLSAWPGLDAKAFFHGPTPPRPSPRDWLFAFAKLFLGIGLIAFVYPRLSDVNDLVGGWIG